MNVKSKHTTILLGAFAMVAIVALAPHAFAQESSSGQGQQGGIPLGSSYSASAGTQSQSSSLASLVGYTDTDNPVGPLQSVAWGVGLAVMGIMTGVGVWSAVRKH